MISSSKTKLMFPATIVAFAIMVSAAPRAYADMCCNNTANVNVNCKMVGCQGSITYQSCAEPRGPDSQLYTTAEVKCCSETFTMFVTPTGKPGGCSDDAMIASARSAALDAVGVWVRTCSGKYVFTVRPVTS
jgi:hypothetical protein